MTVRLSVSGGTLDPFCSLFVVMVLDPGTVRAVEVHNFDSSCPGEVILDVSYKANDALTSVFFKPEHSFSLASVGESSTAAFLPKSDMEPISGSEALAPCPITLQPLIKLQ